MIKKILYPDAVAIIGVSASPKKVGYTLAKNILSAGYRGRVYFINPFRKNILGKRVYQSVLSVNHTIDLAVIAVPASKVAGVLEECGKKKIRQVMIISAGFSEIGPVGEKREKIIQEIAEKYSIQILGPNCLGILNSVNKLNASFAAGMIERGTTAFFSQSGALCTAMLDWSKNVHLGFSQFLSIGNKLMVDECDLLRYFKNDPSTKVILGYLEGIKDGRDFLKTAKELTSKKPLIILHPGKSESGKRAIASHTGTLAGDSRVIDAAFLEANIIRAQSLEEFFDLALFFSWQPLMEGDAVAVISNAGGPAVITADLISENSLQLAQLSKETKDRLKTILPATASVHNPIDLVGDAGAKRYQQAISVILQDPAVHALIVILTPQTVTEISQTARVIIEEVKRFPKPLCACFLGGQRVKPGIDLLHKHQIPNFSYPHQAVSVLKKMARYTLLKKKKYPPREPYKKITPDLSTYQTITSQLREEHSQGRRQLNFHLATQLLHLYEIQTPSAVLVVHRDELQKKLSSLTFPLVAKISSPDIVHKSDVGGVIRGISDMKTAQEAFFTIHQRIDSSHPKAVREGIIFQEMITEGIEIIIGAKRDKQFGPVILYGFGGIFVEIFQDVAVRLAPISKTQAMEMIQETRSSAILRGYRGEKGYDIDAVIHAIHALSQMMIDFPVIQEIDLNPAFVKKEKGGLIAVDARILV